MSYFITFDVTRNDLDALVDNLEQKLDGLALAGWLRTQISPFLRARVSARFAGEGDDVSGGWHPLTAATQQIRMNQGFAPGPINRRYGQLYDFLMVSPGIAVAGGFGAELTYPGPAPDWRTEEKLKTAQSGKAKPATPARPVIGVNNNDFLYITSELTAYLIEGIGP
jgi:hypothetical protein